ncbi:MAG: DUF1064 domain-containing protein [Bacteroidia bacterium]|nr:DUF1064 domain-containing protein [Bacteroidia bacterium]
MRYKRRQITRSKKIKEDNIQFASKLELHMYRVLKKLKVPFTYEGQTYVIVDGFHSDNVSYEKTKTKKVLHDRGDKKILPIKYTPDFVDKEYPPRFIIECKGNPNEAFPMRWKLFKKFLHDSEIDAQLFMPRNQKDCEQVGELLKDIL